MKTPQGLQALIDDGVIDEVMRPLKSGKEAAVYVVRSGDDVRCAKVYKDMAPVSYTHLDVYKRQVSSVFVNPTQFGPNEDYTRYPRTPEADTTGLEGAGCDVLWLPTVESMYPFGIDLAARIRVPGVSGVLEGAHRPGHFDGVCTVAVSYTHLDVYKRQVAATVGNPAGHGQQWRLRMRRVGVDQEMVFVRRGPGVWIGLWGFRHHF